MSQYESKKIAHVFFYTEQSLEDIYSEKELQDLEITQQEIEQKSIITLIPGGTIFYYEETDEWDFSLL